MRIFLTAFILFCTWKVSAQSLDPVYIGKDTTFYRDDNFDIAKRDLRYAAGPLLTNSPSMIGSGIVSSVDDKESKLTAQIFGLSTGEEGGDAMAFNIKFSATTDGAFYRTRALARPTFSIAPGIFMMAEPGKWRLSEQEYTKKAKNPDIALAQAKPVKTSYQWVHFSGNFDHGELKFFDVNDNLYEKKRGLLLTSNISLSYNVLRSHNTQDYNLTGLKSSYFSVGIEWVRLSNFRNLPTIDANMQGTGVDTTGATINLYKDLGTHYTITPEAPFVHYRETVIKMQYMFETITGWVISTAVNYHRPMKNQDDLSTPFFNETRSEYMGFEGGIHYSVKNKAGKSIANIGVYGDNKYSNSWSGWIVSLRTSFPINL